MKKILSLLGFIALIGFGCSKSGVKPTPEPPKPEPTLTDLKATPETSWYSGQASLTWSATNATSFKITGPNGEIVTVGSTSYTANNVLPNQNYTITAIGSSTSVTKTIAIQAYTEKTTNLCKEKYWVNTSLQSVSEDSLNYPSAYKVQPLISGKYYFFPNGQAQYIAESSTVIHPLPNWTFTTGELGINRGPDNTWLIDTLSATKHVEHRVNTASNGKQVRSIAVWQAY
jgi:hypothetical protein